MKRLNPDTSKPFVFGDVRTDGFLFCQYSNRLKRNGYFVEVWCNPKTFEKLQAANKAKYHKNRERELDRMSQYRIDNPLYFSEYLKIHRAEYNAHESKRRAKKLQRTPLWLTKEHLQQIESVYMQAKQLTKETGILHHVDHIVPLQGKNVSGLHVPWNLRAIPATENLSKSNTFKDRSYIV